MGLVNKPCSEGCKETRLLVIEDNRKKGLGVAANRFPCPLLICCRPCPCFFFPQAGSGLPVPGQPSSFGLGNGQRTNGKFPPPLNPVTPILKLTKGFSAFLK